MYKKSPFRHLNCFICEGKLLHYY